MSTKKENRFITDVIIRSSKYQLWELYDREPHTLGLLNNESGRLWVKDFNADFFDKDDEWIPWLDVYANRDCWGIYIDDGNSIKYQIDKYIIDKHTSAEITLNNKPIYGINGNDFDHCYNTARTKIYELKELLYRFNVNLKDTHKENGRKIFYKSMPAVIDMIYTEGSMNIKPDCNEEDEEYWWNQMIEPWDNEYSIEDLKVMKLHNGIKVDILSKDIYWCRNDRQIKLNKIKRITNNEGVT